MFTFAVLSLIICIIALALNIKTKNKVVAHIMFGCILIHLWSLTVMLLN